MYGYIVSLYEARKMLQTPGTALIDLRTEEAYRKDHLPEAIGIPFEDNPEFWSRIPRHKVLIVYCYRGNLSMRVTRMLRRAGIQAYSIAGGYETYRKQRR